MSLLGVDPSGLGRVGRASMPWLGLPQMYPTAGGVLAMKKTMHTLTKTTTQPCSAKVYEPQSWMHSHQCTRRGMIEEDGKRWCKQHSPSSTKARHEASAARFQADIDRRMAPHDEIERLRAINTPLLKALERSASRLHGLTDEPVCLRNIFNECPTHYCVESRAALKAAKE